MTTTDAATESDDAPIVAKLVELLADATAHTFEQLFDGVVDLLPEDTDEAEGLLDAVFDSHGRFITLDDERWIDLHALLEGRCFTHRLTAAEATAAVVPLRPDIDFPTVPFADAIPLADGAVGDIVFSEDVGDIDLELAEELQGGGLKGPDGWLGDAGADSVVGVWFDDGTLACRPAEPDPALTQGAADALSRTFTELVEHHDDPVHLIELVLAWLLAEPGALRAPHEPMIALLEAAGLESRGDFVGRAGTKWLTPHQRMRIEERALHSEAYGFDECCHDALDLVNGVFHGAIRDAEPRDVAVALSHGAIAAAFVARLIGRAGHLKDEMAKELVGFADELVSASRGAEAAGPLYAQSVGFEILGEVVEAEDAVRAALRADPSHRAACEAMAGYLEDRGDAARALEHLHRAGIRDDDVQAERLAAIVAQAAPRVGRNDPCPCGSGRKFKACCIDKPGTPAEMQFGWLYEKALAFVMHPARRDAPTHLAMHALGVEGSDEPASVRALSDRRFAELSLFDEGLLERFLDEREPLLPAAEVAIAETWLEHPLALFEVMEVRPGEGVSLRNTQSGEASQARELVASSDVEVGEWVTARLLPVGDALWVGGPITRVPEQLRASAATVAGDGDACAWAEWIGLTRAPPPPDGSEPTLPAGAHHHHDHHGHTHP